jgi:hypothetical protein
MLASKVWFNKKWRPSLIPHSSTMMMTKAIRRIMTKSLKPSHKSHQMMKNLFPINPIKTIKAIGTLTPVLIKPTTKTTKKHKKISKFPHLGEEIETTLHKNK